MDRSEIWTGPISFLLFFQFVQFIEISTFFQLRDPAFIEIDKIQSKEHNLILVKDNKILYAWSDFSH